MKSSVLSLFTLATTALAYYPDPFTAASTLTNPKNLAAEGAVQANGGYFWIGKEPSSYCPSGVSGLNCTVYPGDSTVLAGGNNTLSLNVAVPGGQQIWVDANGALGYTIPHSGATPPGSSVTGFERTISQAGGAPEYVSYKGAGWAACATTTNETAFQVFAQAGLNSTAGCSTFLMRSYYYPAVNAWEY